MSRVWEWPLAIVVGVVYAVLGLAGALIWAVLVMPVARLAHALGWRPKRHDAATCPSCQHLGLLRPRGRIA